MSEYKKVKPINITIPIELYEWMESERGKILCNRSRFISELLRDVKYLNTSINIDDDVVKDLRVIKGV